MFSKKTSFLLFGGKGGVGKTSCAAAAAVHLASSGKKTLIISTDPAHSLSDSFEKTIGGEIREVGKKLFAVEIDPKKAMEEYRDEFMPRIEKMEMLKGFGLDGMFDMAGSTPGIDEVAAFDKFLRYMQSGEYDAIVFDTAPTGHTLRFLSLPDVLDSWVGKMISLRMKLSSITGLFSKIIPFGGDEKPKIDTGKLDEMKERIKRAKELLSDPGKTSYSIVTIPEGMAIQESGRSLRTLKEYGIPVKSVIVNQIIPENVECRFCSEKRKIQQERMQEIREKFGGVEIKEIPLFSSEIKGMPALKKLSSLLYR